MTKGSLLLTLFFCIQWMLVSCGENAPVSVQKSDDKLDAEPFPNAYLKETIEYQQISGVDSNLLSLDLYHFGQKNNLVPIVVYVHGGGWRQGDKSNQLDNKLNLFFSLRYLFVSVNYRLSPFNPSSLAPDRIMFPIHNEDVANAVAWVYENISSFGGDKNKIALMGHSAGAHLVSLTGTSVNFLPARGIPLNAIKGIVSIDTEGYDVSSQAGSGEAIYLNAFGTDPNTWVLASPVNNVFAGTSYPKFFIAKRGIHSRLAIANAFINKLLSVGVDVTQVQLNQYDHEGINDAIGAPDEVAITGPLKAFFSLCFE